MSPATAAVEARDLQYSYGDRQALRGVSFEVGHGEIFGFLGPNGGGKTTLFRLLATLASPDHGTASVLGASLPAEAALVRLQLGVVFQVPSLDKVLTVEENLLHQGRLYSLRGGDLRRRIASLVQRFGLGDRSGDPVKELSGGLKRRVEIAKALLHRPRILLLDEPSTGLDPGARREVWTVLEELRSNHEVTILLTTHFMEEGDRCDRVALIDQGRVVAVGEPETLKEEIGGDVVTLKTDRAEAVQEDLRFRFGLEATVHDDVLRFEHPKAHESVAQLIEGSPGRIEALTISRPTLEDVFLQRTGHSLWEDE